MGGRQSFRWRVWHRLSAGSCLLGFSKATKHLREVTGRGADMTNTHDLEGEGPLQSGDRKP